MEGQQQKDNFCKKIAFGTDFNDPTIILGLIIGEDADFLKFKTAKHEYWINKKLIQCIEDTQEIFREGEQ